MWYLIVANKQMEINIRDINLLIFKLDEVKYIWENANKIGIKKNIKVWFLVSNWWNTKENVNKNKIKK